MAEPAIRHMTLKEFLRWDDGTDTRYELIDGFPVAMGPPAEAHRILAVPARFPDRRRARRPAAVQCPDRAWSGAPRSRRFLLCPRHCRHLRAQRSRSTGDGVSDPYR